MLMEQLSGFTVGTTVYRFIDNANVNWIPATDGWVCYMDELQNYTGVGKTCQKAFEELKINIHTHFQRLCRKRPFEMTEQEVKHWPQLTGLIDLLYYKTTTPIVVREVGCVSYQKLSRPVMIEWMSGKKYFIEPDKVPGDLMSCAPGQWVEAVVKRDPITYRELEIESIGKISFRIPSKSEMGKLWGDMPKADLETTDWAW